MSTRGKFGGRTVAAKRLFVLLWVAGASCCLTLPAAAFFSNLGLTTNGFFGGNLDNTSYRLATDFLTGASPTTITKAVLRLENPDNIGHHYTLSLFTDGGSGLPGSLVGSLNTSLIAPLANPAVTNSFSSSGITLAPNTAYWAVLQINEAITNSDSFWSGLGSQATDPGSLFSTIPGTATKRSTDSGATWTDGSTGNFWFSLSGTTVPEPATFALVGIGVLGVLLSRGKHRRNVDKDA
jgi:hypothetical protein